MGIFEIILIGIGLSMDAAAVSMTNGMIYGKQKWLSMALFFGFFQGLMPLLGYLACGFFAQFINQYASLAVFIILGFIGAKMIKDGFSHDNHDTNQAIMLTYQLLFFQAIATSIDAFAVGIGFSAMGVNIMYSVVIIAITTFLCSLLAIAIGQRFGDFLGNKAEILGGIILILIAIKALF